MLTAGTLTHTIRSIVLVATLFSLQACTSVPEGISPVDNFSLQRYLGTWYEIARLDHPFERGLNNITATYTLRDDGGVDVLNRGFNQADNDWQEALGKAYFVDQPNVGHLKVSFFGPFYASYVIMDLDHDDYQYALVTGPDRDYLWLLARRPVIAKATLESLLQLAQSKGFDTDALIWVEHNQSR